MKWVRVLVPTSPSFFFFTLYKGCPTSTHKGPHISLRARLRAVIVHAYIKRAGV